MKTLATAGICGGLLLVAMGPAALAQTFKEHRSTLTVVEPIEVPGKVLDPGTYVIKVVETQNNRNIVQVTDVEEKTVFAMAIATPHVGLTAPPNTTFIYYPTSGGAATRTLRTWFAPNDRYGQDLVYPRARALELARIAKEPVRSYEIVGNATPLTQRQLETIEVRDVTDDSVAEPARAAEPSSVIASNRLPATASDLPTLGALGILALGAAGALRLGRHLRAS